MAAALASLPIELRQTVARFPVTLYTSTDCSPCESGRRLLQARGVPFVERQVTSGDDAEALNRLTGGRSVPTLTIGSQALRRLRRRRLELFISMPRLTRASRSCRAATRRHPQRRWSSVSRGASAQWRVRPRLPTRSRCRPRRRPRPPAFASELAGCAGSPTPGCRPGCRWPRASRPALPSRAEPTPQKISTMLRAACRSVRAPN